MGRRPVGPNDKRWARRRCEGCRASHLKCDGQSPCERCLGADQPCLRPDAEKRLVVISETKHFRKLMHLPDAVSPLISPDEISTCTTHLFTSFLRQHCFAGQIENGYRDLKALIPCSRALQNAGLALGTLDLEIKTGLRRSKQGTALKYYHEAVRWLQEEIASGEPSVERCDAHVWTTVLLGIFELMFDSSGIAFLRHWMYGTSRLLQRQASSPNTGTRDRQLYLIVRMLELIRALIFSTDTFLVEPQWQCSMRWFPGGAEAFGWHPIDALFDLMVQVIIWNHKTDPVIRSLSLSEAERYSELLSRAAREGVRLRQRFHEWDSMASMWSAAHTSADPKASTIDAQMILARVLYHTLRICLNSLYRHEHYDHLGLSVSRLSEEAKRIHATEIIRLVATALHKTNIAAVLLCWPLQVAGLHLTSKNDTDQVVELLREIEGRGFVVARSFEETVSNGWR